MLLDNFQRSQFGAPSGLVGSVLMGPLLNAANQRLMRRTIDLLQPAGQDRILDIGFGGGYSLVELACPS